MSGNAEKADARKGQLASLSAAPQQLNVSTKCGSRAEFVHLFRPFLDERTVFVPSKTSLPVGQAVKFAIGLSTGGVVLAGSGVVIEVHEKRTGPERRSGMRIRVGEVSNETRGIFEEILRQKKGALGRMTLVKVPVGAVGTPPPVAVGGAPGDRDRTGVDLDGPAPAASEAPTRVQIDDASTGFDEGAPPPPDPARTAGSPFTLPANPLAGMDTRALSHFIEVNLAEAESDEDNGVTELPSEMLRAATPTPAPVGAPRPAAPAARAPGASPPPVRPFAPPAVAPPRRGGTLPPPALGTVDLPPVPPARAPGAVGAPPLPGRPPAGPPAAVGPSPEVAGGIVMEHAFDLGPPLAAPADVAAGAAVAPAAARRVTPTDLLSVAPPRRASRRPLAGAAIVLVGAVAAGAVAFRMDLLPGFGGGAPPAPVVKAPPPPARAPRPPSAPVEIAPAPALRGEQAAAPPPGAAVEPAVEAVAPAASAPGAPPPGAAVEPAVEAVAPLAPAPPAPAAAPAAGACRADIATTPRGVSVFLRGRLLGKAPLRAVKVPCGEVALAFSYRRYRDTKAVLSVAAGERAELNVRMQRPEATLALVADPPGAVFKINGRTIGRAPRRVQVPRFERLRVEATAPGYQKWTRKLYVTKADVPLHASLSRAR